MARTVATLAASAIARVVACRVVGGTVARGSSRQLWRAPPDPTLNLIEMSIYSLHLELGFA